MAEGGCHCGAVRYEAQGAPERHAICHCTDCRLCAGAPAVAWAIWPAAKVRVTRGEPAVYASSEHARRYFCAACGTGLYYVNEAVMPGLVDVQSATLDDPGQYAPTDQIQVADRIPWMATAHTLPEHARYPPFE